MATILIKNPTKNQMLNVIDSQSHYVDAAGVILAMPDLKRWLQKYDTIHDFMYTENGFSLCKVDEGEEIHSEEQTLITAG